MCNFWIPFRIISSVKDFTLTEKFYNAPFFLNYFAEKTYRKTLTLEWKANNSFLGDFDWSYRSFKLVERLDAKMDKKEIDRKFGNTKTSKIFNFFSRKNPMSIFSQQTNCSIRILCFFYMSWQTKCFLASF